MNPIDTLCAPKQRDSYDVNPEAYSERCQKSKMLLFAKISFHNKVYTIVSCYSIVMSVILLNGFNFLLPLLFIPSVFPFVIEITTTFCDWYKRNFRIK